MHSARQHRVAVVAMPGVYPYELGIAGRFLGAARRDGAPAYDVVTCSIDGAPVPTNADFAIAVAADAGALDEADTIVVPPWVDAQTVQGDPLGLAARSHARIVSFCTGAFALADAGILDGRSATTHWCEADAFAARFPAVRLERDALFVDEGTVLTAAGASAGVDLALHLIALDLGAAAAAEVSRVTLAPPHRGGGQAQFVPRPTFDDDGDMGRVRAWLAERVDRPVSLAEAAAAHGLGIRTLTRRFRAETGVTVGDWLAQARVDRARELLETTQLGVDAVADASGFGSAAALRQHFRDRVGLSPKQYRMRFAAREA